MDQSQIIDSPTIDLAPLKEWFAADESLAVIVGDRISTVGLNVQLPAVMISHSYGSDDSEVAGFQLNAWTEGDNSKPLAESLRRILVERIGAMSGELFSSVKIIRDNLTEVAPGNGYNTIRRRNSIDVEVTREVGA